MEDNAKNEEIQHQLQTKHMKLKHVLNMLIGAVSFTIIAIIAGYFASFPLEQQIKSLTHQMAVYEMIRINSDASQECGGEPLPITPVLHLDSLYGAGITNKLVSINGALGYGRTNLLTDSCANLFKALLNKEKGSNDTTRAIALMAVVAQNTAQARNARKIVR